MSENKLKHIKFFKALANEDRLEIIKLLQKSGELWAQQVQNNFYLEQSTTSHHLNKLRLCGITKARKEGRNVYYSFDEDTFKTNISDFLEFINKKST